jgi:hypothetical protein
MALKDTCKRMDSMLTCLTKDLAKAEKGNKAASQRVRTGSIKFAKLAKQYRKESVKCEKAIGKKPKKAAKKVARKKVAKKKKVVRRKRR